MRLVLGSLGTFVLALIFTPLIRAFAHRVGMVAVPRKDRWHSQPTALLGGIGLYAAFWGGYLIFGPGVSRAYPILAAGTVLFVIGLVDDLVHLKPYTKLVIQMVAATVVVYFGIRLRWTTSDPVNACLTILWLVGITNAINLLDNMDGAAGGISLIACVFMVIAFLLNGQPGDAMLPALLAGALLGFLLFNFHPASIFMGDCGSMFLGFMLGGFALLGNYLRTSNLTSVLLTPVLIMLIPIFDTTMVTITRKLSGRPVSQGGRDHTSHRLVALGMSERRAVASLYLFAIASGLLGLLIRGASTAWVLLVSPGFALMVLLVGFYLGMMHISEAEQPAPDNVVLQALTDFAYKRRVFEILLDLLLIVLSYYGAYVLRFDGHIPDEQMQILTNALPLVIGIEMLCFLAFGIYGGLWRYMGVNDLLLIGKPVLVGSVVSGLVVMFTATFPSRGVCVLNGLLLFVFECGSRLSFRLLRAVVLNVAQPHPDALPVLIYGAGDGGELLIREILNNAQYRYVPVGFLDDDERKAGKLIHGYRIFKSSQLPYLIQKRGVREILVSSSKVPESKLEEMRTLGLCPKRMRIRFE